MAVHSGYNLSNVQFTSKETNKKRKAWQDKVITAITFRNHMATISVLVVFFFTQVKDSSQISRVYSV